MIHPLMLLLGTAVCPICHNPYTALNPNTRHGWCKACNDSLLEVRPDLAETYGSVGAADDDGDLSHG